MKVLAITLLLIFSRWIASAQTGTYRLDYKSGATCTIAVTIEKNQLYADVFAWWHTASGQHGAFSGLGQFSSKGSVVKSPDDTDCQIRLSFSAGNLLVHFSNCMSSNLPDDFSGSFKKITIHTPGDYEILPDRAYFYKTARTATRIRAYLVKGNKINVDLENIIDAQWVFINYTNASGETTSGYMPWSAIEIIK